jgi:hypothetical protein
VTSPRLLLPLLALAAVVVPGAAAQSGLIVGVTDDSFLTKPAAAAGAARQLGLGAYRVSLTWSPGETRLAPGDVAALNGLIPVSNGLRIVVTVYGKANAAPVDANGRQAYCSYVHDLVTRYPTINDVVIWNEANLGFFWLPQFDADGTSAAPAAYEALLAQCWDTLHAVRPSVNVITTVSSSGNDDPTAASNVSHSPGNFIRKLGAAYRASGRTRPIFDTFGINPYGMSSAESPWQQHLSPQYFGEGDLDRLVQALDDGFGGTAQPVPGSCAAGAACPTIWYLEAGYQTIPTPAHQGAYTGTENDDHPVPDTAAAGVPTQSSQLRDGIDLAFCQPYVGAFFNFLLWDEPSLARWQSGVFWADGSPKASFGALQAITSTVRSGTVDCAKLQAQHGTPIQPAGDALVERIEWPSLTSYSSFNEIWSFAVDAHVDASFHASIVTGKTASLTVAGKLARGRPRTISFPQTRLRPGTYRIQLVLAARGKASAPETRTSPPFVVE